jgi:NitT/TauT family transport system ATP-binding protein
MLVVSHNIEEAVMMADRVLIFASDPGRIRHQLSVQLARPRDANGADARALVDEIYALMTSGAARPGRGTGAAVGVGLGARLPLADVGRMDGLLDLLADQPFNGRADLPQLAEESELTDAQLLPLAEALSLLRLAQLDSGDLHLTPLGHSYVAASHVLRQDIFGQQLLAHVPLVAHIRHSLEQEHNGRLPAKPFQRLLDEHLEEAVARKVLDTAISWARHGEVFEYDYRAGVLHLPTGEDAPAPSGG